MKIIRNTFNEQNLRWEESLYHVANGYFGIRGNFEEAYPADTQTVRGTYINGFYDTVDIHYPEKCTGFPDTAQRMVNLPDFQTTKLYFDDEEFSLFTGKIVKFERTLDMTAGTATRHVIWISPKGKTFEIIFTRMASHTRKEIFLTTISVAAIGSSGTLKMVSTANCDVFNFYDRFDPRVASELDRYVNFKQCELIENCGVTMSTTTNSHLQVAIAMKHKFSTDATQDTTKTDTGFVTTASISYGETPVVIEKYVAFADSRLFENVSSHAVKTLGQAMNDGAEKLLSEQVNFLADFWKSSGVANDGDSEINEGMLFNLYELLQSAGNDSISNIAAKGLSGEGYEGHYFWDTEIYMFPFFLLTRPSQAQHLLDFRFSILNHAREHARILGHKQGALYSWRTITGSECSTYFPAGSAQYHITGDVAYSFLQYYNVTGDIHYMAQKGAEVLVETARLWLDAGCYDRKGRFCFNDVTGPDEYTAIVNNNYFTNLTARNNLQGAAYICDELKRQQMFGDIHSRLRVTDEEIEKFRKVADEIYIPYDEALDISPQDDSFLDKAKWDLAATPKENFPLLLHYYPLYLYRHQVCKQADTVLAHFLYEDAAESTMRKSYDYYEEITTHDSSLSTCIFSIMASQLGMHEKAYNYFLHTVRTDLDDKHGNAKDGLHTANMGGAYLALVSGFAGLRIRRDGFHFKFTLPSAWKGYEFNLIYKGSLFNVKVTADTATFELLSGNAISVFVGDNEVNLNGRVEVRV